jgi:hypothetical protein
MEEHIAERAVRALLTIPRYNSSYPDEMQEIIWIDVTRDVNDHEDYRSAHRTIGLAFLPNAGWSVKEAVSNRFHFV